jgi:phosphoglycerate dehydrogenase-like enzyme
MPRIAIFDDYQNVALKLADWSPVTERATVTVFSDHLSDANDIVDRLREFDAVCVMRERTPLTRNILERLPRLKLIVSTGRRNASIDIEAAAEFGIEVMHTNYDSSSTIELTWALILAAARNLTTETASVRSGGWQRTVGDGIRGKVLGVLGLGNIGSQVARIGGAFGMEVMAWSENLTPEKAAAAGARLVSKRELFERADILTIHLVLSARTRGLVSRAELSLMKTSARLVNTSRGPIVDEDALVENSGRRPPGRRCHRCF